MQLLKELYSTQKMRYIIFVEFHVMAYKEGRIREATEYFVEPIENRGWQMLVKTEKICNTISM
jgi:hypothetical protein